MRSPNLLVVDATINLLLGLLLVAFPAGLVEALGIPQAEPAFYPSILGAVLIGIGVIDTYFMEGASSAQAFFLQNDAHVLADRVVIVGARGADVLFEDDHVIVLNELHLKRLLRAYLAYYHAARTHLALDKQCPEPRSVESPEQGSVFAFPHLGGLHHEYRRAA